MVLPPNCAAPAAQVLVISCTPPPAPPAEVADLGPWAPSEEALQVQRTVLAALDRVSWALNLGLDLLLACMFWAEGTSWL